MECRNHQLYHTKTVRHNLGMGESRITRLRKGKHKSMQTFFLSPCISSGLISFKRLWFLTFKDFTNTMVSQICKHNGEFSTYDAPSLNAVFINPHQHRTEIMELFVEQLSVIAVQLAFYRAGSYPILFSNYFVAGTIGTFARNGIIEPGIEPLVFSKTDMVENLRMAFVTASALIALYFNINLFLTPSHLFALGLR